MTTDQAEQLLAFLESIAESLQAIRDAVDTATNAAMAKAWDEEG